MEKLLAAIAKLKAAKLEKPTIKVEEHEPAMIVTGDLADFVTGMTASITLGEDDSITIESLGDMRRGLAILDVLKAVMAMAV